VIYYLELNWIKTKITISLELAALMRLTLKQSQVQFLRLTLTMTAAKKNKNGVKNSLVNNINARKKKGTSRPKKKSTVSKQAYAKMKNNWK
jgi:hypothetical protein